MRLTDKIFAGQRISAYEAEALYELPLFELGALADHRRRIAVPCEKVGYIVDRIINYTNRCVAGCSFCAFHADAGRVPAYDLTTDQILAKISELVAVGGTQVMLQGGLHPDHDLNWYLDLLRGVRCAYPDIYLHSFSPAEIVHIANRESLSYRALVASMRDAGLDSIPGASDVLVDAVRSSVSPRKCTREQWREVMHAISDEGMVSSATLTYGMGETLVQRIEHLCFVRRVQDETGVFQAFIPWSFSPDHTKMIDIPRAGGTEYLQMVAIARIVLDNVTHLQAGWLTEGIALAQLALAMGANDMGGVLTEELVVQATGMQNRVTVPLIESVIRNAGKEPVQRNSRYHPIG